MSEPTTDRPPGKTAALSLPSIRGVGEMRHLGLFGALALLVVVGLITRPDNFATASNLVSILSLAATIGVITVGATFVIIGGGIDLSVGAVMALASVWATTLATQSYGPVVMAICAILVGTGAGLVNGILIAYGRLVPFIATLAMLVAARGLAQRMSDRKTQLIQSDNAALVDLSTTRVAGIPLLVYVFALVVVLGWVLLNRTTFGRRTYAVGGNPEAARLAGIDVRRHTMLLYALSGLCCGIAAILIMARTTTGSSTHGDLYELDAIAAVIIGGTLLTGGRGTIMGSILGLLIFTLITNLFILNGLNTSDQLIAKGLIIVVAVLLQRRNLKERAP
ncbi:ABC transporter permease [Nonomuraea fuscirosea]|jgi:ribose transport system permease protein|uniref:Ribose transport system permease protein n=1 Tax=Nonomuraea fuscirosea TaxID=1291556 RepID=A0A2T0M4I0_9ACTN|nr:ABC transporter permease [Nonomuraea fuscirosea]PRX51810.1 ribose transport system permease protein [Nonomuraea fuscirosea]WSA53132.1 ABC transporter permease [Nonomuraea fuscirosea]